MSFLSISEVLASRKKGELLALLLRHAERRHIMPTDPDYGAHVRITERGFEQAMHVGKELSCFTSAAYYSSPVMRCRETASAIAASRGDTRFDVPEKVSVIQSLAEFYVADFEEYTRLLREGFYGAICEYLETGKRFGFLPLKETSEELLQLLINSSFEELNVFISHDAWIVPFLTHFTEVRFAPHHWINFLSGAAVFFVQNHRRAFFP
jgi:broad specificity phosphatase PhoE